MWLLIGALAGVACASLCHNEHAVSASMHAVYVDSLRRQTRADTLEYLYGLCAADDRCRRAYYMDLDDGANADDQRRAFEYLVRHWTHAGGESLATMTEEFCDAGDPAQLRDRLWLAKLRLEAYESLSVRCGANERFVFVPSTMQGECICADEHNCQENGHLASEPLTLSTAALVLASAVVTVYVCLRIRNDRKLFQTFRKIQEECGEDSPIRRQFAERIKI